MQPGERPGSVPLRHSDAERLELRAFYEIFRTNGERLGAALMRTLETVPSRDALRAALAVRVASLGAGGDAEAIRAALVDDDWSNYSVLLEARGDAYAQMGIPFAELYPVINSMRRAFVADIVGTLTDAQRPALLGLNRFLDLTLSGLATAYIDSSQRVTEDAENQLGLYLEVFRGSSLAMVIYRWETPFDTGSLRLLAVNSAAARGAAAHLLGSVGRLLREFAPEFVEHQITRMFVRALLEKRPQMLARAPSVRNVGRVYELRADPLGGNILVVAFEDITEQVRLEQTVARHVLELERSNRELDDFAYVTSHDLRSPLQDMRNLSGWLLEDAGKLLPESSQRHLRLLQERGARMERLLDDILAYSRIGRVTESHTVFSAADAYASVVSYLRPPPATSITLHDPEGVRLHARRGPFETVLRNLMGNAIKHHDRSDPQILVSIERLDGLVRVSVEDDGPGIAPALQERAFRMFQTLRPRDEVEGSGIGLAQVKKAVELEGGTVEMRSIGRGTTVQFTWPATFEETDGRA